MRPDFFGTQRKQMREGHASAMASILADNTYLIQERARKDAENAFLVQERATMDAELCSLRAYNRRLRQENEALRSDVMALHCMTLQLTRQPLTEQH